MEDDEVPEKKSSIFDNDIGKPIYSESAIDGTVTVVGHYGGNTNNGTGGACTVNKIHDMIIVKYEDGVTEQVKEEQLRFI